MEIFDFFLENRLVLSGLEIIRKSPIEYNKTPKSP